MAKVVALLLLCGLVGALAHSTANPRGGTTLRPRRRGTAPGVSHRLLSKMPKAKKDEVVNAFYSEAPLSKKDFGDALGLAGLYHGGVIFEFYNVKTKKTRSSYAVEFYAKDGVAGTLIPSYDPATKKLKFNGDKLVWANHGVVDVVKVDMKYWTKKRQVAQIPRHIFNRKVRFYIGAYSNEYPIYQLFTVTDGTSQEEESTCVRFVFEVLKAIEESKVCVGLQNGAIKRNIVELRDALDQERVLDISAEHPENRAKLQTWFTTHFEAIVKLKSSFASLNNQMRAAMASATAGKPPPVDALSDKLRQMASALGNKIYLYNGPSSVREVHINKDKKPVTVTYAEDSDSAKWKGKKCPWTSTVASV